MEIERRFIFHGEAAVASGMILRPEVHIPEVPGASALTVAGGVSVGRLPGPVELGKFASIRAGRTLARGDFDNLELAQALTHGKVRADEVPTTTSVEAEVEGISIGQDPDPVLRVGRLRAAMIGKSPKGSGEPSLRPADLAIDRVVVTSTKFGEFVLDVDLAGDVYRRFDTRAKLLAAADDDSFVAEYGEPFLMDPGTSAARQPLRRRDGMIYATLVRRMSWRDGRAFPGAQIDHHVLTLPDFGKAFFGEIFVTAGTRRITMLRVQLGSPIGGFAALADIHTNGTWYP